MAERETKTLTIDFKPDPEVGDIYNATLPPESGFFAAELVDRVAPSGIHYRSIYVNGKENWPHGFTGIINGVSLDLDWNGSAGQGTQYSRERLTPEQVDGILGRTPKGKT